MSWTRFDKEKPDHGVEVLVYFCGRISIGYYDAKTGKMHTLVGYLPPVKCWWMPLPEQPEDYDD